jgi:RNA methyltransferase, TrmH family
MENISNNEIKNVKALNNKKFRDETGLFTVAGEKMVAEAGASDFEVVKVYRMDEIGETAMERMSGLSSPPPVLAVVRQKAERPLEVRNGLYLILDGIRDPGNLGTILRLSDWFGVTAVLAGGESVELYNPKVVQSTMGAVFRVEYHTGDSCSFARQILSAGGRVYGTTLDGENIYSRELQTGSDCPVAIVVGNESNGIGPQMLKLLSDRLFIPPYPPQGSGCESLNAATATAITLAEFRRRAML